MSAAYRAFEAVTAEVDRAVAGLLVDGEDPSWLISASGQVFRITLFRMRPNGTAWFEGEPVAVPGFNNAPGRRIPSTLELRRRTAMAIARAQGLKDELAKAEAAEILAPILGSISEAQLEGLACAYCHKPASGGQAMVPLTALAGLEFTGAHQSLFVCDPDCRPAVLEFCGCDDGGSDRCESEPRCYQRYMARHQGEAEPVSPRPCMHNGYHRPGECPEANAQEAKPPFLGLISHTNGGAQ